MKPDTLGATGEPRMDDSFEEQCVEAVTTAAADLGLDPRALVAELAQGEIGLLVTYLRAASDEVADLDLRERIDELLHRLTTWTGAG
ncbi:MAG: hypothetical protein JWM27_1126 [Gemmatimonadetes bacterium]|nr:hypothetical protein [Gemmatimonadota bacterium]